MIRPLILCHFSLSCVFKPHINSVFQYQHSLLSKLQFNHSISGFDYFEPLTTHKPRQHQYHFKLKFPTQPNSKQSGYLNKPIGPITELKRHPNFIDISNRHVIAKIIPLNSLPLEGLAKNRNQEEYNHLTQLINHMSSDKTSRLFSSFNGFSPRGFLICRIRIAF